MAVRGGVRSSLNFPSRGAFASPDEKVGAAAAMIPHATDHPPRSKSAPAAAAEASVFAPMMNHARDSEVSSVSPYYEVDQPCEHA